MAIRNRTPFWQLQAFRIVLLQLTVSMLLAVVATLLGGVVGGYSAAVGASIAWLPNAWFIYKAFRYQEPAPCRRLSSHSGQAWQEK